MKLPRIRLTYANVVSTLALTFALGMGGAYAANQLIGTDDIEKNAITSKLIDNDQVKSKDLKDNKAVKGLDVKDESLGGADILDGSVGLADLAADSVDAGKIAAGAVGSSELANLEAPHLVGAAGEPGFGTGKGGDCIYRNVQPADAISGTTPVGFYKDQLGFVHLQGLYIGGNNPAGTDDGVCDAAGVGGTADGILFTLPPGYRPATSTVHAFGVGGGGVIVSGDQPIVEGAITLPSGSVFVTPPGSPGSLDAVVFPAADATTIRAEGRAPGPGAAGAPADLDLFAFGG